MIRIILRMFCLVLLILFLVYENTECQTKVVSKSKIIEIMENLYYQSFKESELLYLDSLILYVNSKAKIGDQVYFISNRLSDGLRFIGVQKKLLDSSKKDKNINYDFFKAQFESTDYCFLIKEKKSKKYRVVFKIKNSNLSVSIIEISGKSITDNNAIKIFQNNTFMSVWCHKTPYSFLIIDLTPKKPIYYCLKNFWEYNSEISFCDLDSNIPEYKKPFSIIKELAIELNKIGVFRKMEYYGQ